MFFFWEVKNYFYRDFIFNQINNCILQQPATKFLCETVQNFAKIFILGFRVYNRHEHARSDLTENSSLS